jgi:hypothetical protein
MSELKLKQLVNGEWVDANTDDTWDLVAGAEVRPLINAKQRDRVEQIVSQAVQMGAQVVAGGNRPESPNEKLFLSTNVHRQRTIKQFSPQRHKEHREKPSMCRGASPCAPAFIVFAGF